MVLLTILTIIVALLVVFTIATIATIGAMGIIVCGDVIVCIALIALLMRWIIRRRRNR